jgi:DivIVA domain-containing protein
MIGEADLKDLETRGRYLRRRSFGGYGSDEGDAFLMELHRRLRDLLNENKALRDGVSLSQLWSEPHHITALDVQERRIERARFGGYDMRSVDEYLDEATEVIMALTQENEALRGASSELDRGEDVSR